MLPDFPTLTNELLTRLNAVMRGSGNDPLLRLLPPFQQHEGDRFETRQSHGATTGGSYDNPIRAEVTISVDDIRTRGPNATLEALAQLNSMLHDGMGRRAVETIETAAASVGNVIDMKGRPPTAETILEVLDVIELSFDDDGSWRPPQMLGSPAVEKKFRAAFEELETNPELRSKRDAIVNRQREEWRGREAGRALVD